MSVALLIQRASIYLIGRIYINKDMGETTQNTNKVEESKTAKGPVLPKKLTYEELENTCSLLSNQSRQLHEQNSQLRQALGDANMVNFYKRLDYLWLCINSEAMYLTEEFRSKCAEEFMELMAPQQAHEAPDSSEGENKEE